MNNVNTDYEEMLEWVIPKLQEDGISLIADIHERYGLSELDCMKLIRQARLRLEDGRQI